MALKRAETRWSDMSLTVFDCVNVGIQPVFGLGKTQTHRKTIK